MRQKKQADEDYDQYFKTLVYDEEMKANQVDRGFLGARQSYTIKPVERNLYSYSNFFNQSKKELTRVLQVKVDEMRGLKFKLSFLGYFHFGTLLRATPKEEKNFRSGIYQVLSHEEIKEAVNDAMDELGEEINSLNLDGSFIRISKLILIFIATIPSEVDLTFPYQILLETRKLGSTSRITMTNVSCGLFLQVNIPKERILDGKVYILIMQKSSRAGIESIP